MRTTKLALYVLGLGVIGFVAGFFAGGSSSPVIGIILPLIFSVIGGTAGISIGRTQIANGDDVSRIALVGASLVTFGILLWLGGVWGASLRLGRNILVSQEPVDLRSSVRNAGTVAEAVTLSVLAARLQALGTDGATVGQVLALASSEIRQLPFSRSLLVDLASKISEASAVAAEKGGDSSIQRALLLNARLLEGAASTDYGTSQAQRLFVERLVRQVEEWLSTRRNFSAELRAALTDLLDTGRHLMAGFAIHSEPKGGFENSSLMSEVDSLISTISQSERRIFATDYPLRLRIDEDAARQGVGD